MKSPDFTWNVTLQAALIRGVVQHAVVIARKQRKHPANEWPTMAMRLRLHMGVKDARLHSSIPFDLHEQAIVTGLRKPIRKRHLGRKGWVMH